MKKIKMTLVTLPEWINDYTRLPAAVPHQLPIFIEINIEVVLHLNEIEVVFNSKKYLG